MLKLKTRKGNLSSLKKTLISHPYENYEKTALIRNVNIPIPFFNSQLSHNS